MQENISEGKMKKSELTVTMPMTSFEELEMYKTKYFELLDELKSCFNTQLVDSKVANCINFETSKALKIAEKALPLKYKGINIECVE